MYKYNTMSCNGHLSDQELIFASEHSKGCLSNFRKNVQNLLRLQAPIHALFGGINHTQRGNKQQTGLSMQRCLTR